MTLSTTKVRHLIHKSRELRGALWELDRKPCGGWGATAQAERAIDNALPHGVSSADVIDACFDRRDNGSKFAETWILRPSIVALLEAS